MSSTDRWAALQDDERNELERLLMDFEQSWSPLLLSDYCRRLTSQPKALGTQLALTELVKIDLQRRWSIGQGLLLEEYLKQIAVLGPLLKIDAELLLVEFKARRQADASVRLESYASRFPKEFDRLADLVSRNSQSGPTIVRESDEHQESSRASVETSRVNDGRDTTPTRTRKQEPLPERFGRYQILRELGSGAMGTVYLAHDHQLERQVAIKTPSFPEEDHELISRFYREARAAAKVQHRNICPIYDVGEIDGRSFISMAYVRGQTLAKYISPRKVPPPRSSAILIHRLAVALAEAHRHNVIHRDLKPANIMIDGKKEPVVMDFGLACQTDLESRMTKSGTIVGTPAYMSPEQLTGDPKDVGPVADIYSLGVILYELLTGDIPFRGTIAQVVYKITSEEPIPPSRNRSEIDPELEVICAKMMAKQVADRFQSMDEVAAALKDYIKGYAEVAKAQSDPSPADQAGSTPISKMIAKTEAEETSDATALNALFASRTSDELVPISTHAPHSLGRPTQANGLRQWVRGKPFWISAMAGVLAVVFGIVLFVNRSQGTIRFEVSSALKGLEVLVNGNPISATEPVEARVGSHEVALNLEGTSLPFKPSGQVFVGVVDGARWRVAVSIDNQRLTSNSFFVNRDQQTILKVDLVSDTPTMLRGLEFDGIDNVVKTPLAYDGSHPITIEAHLTSFAIQRGSYHVIVTNSQRKAGLGIFVRNNVLDTFGSTTELNPFPRISSKRSIKPGRRVHVASTYDLKKLSLFVGGRLMGEKVLELAHQPSSLPFDIGGNPTGGAYFRGLIDEVHVSNVVRYQRDFTPTDRFKADEHTLLLYKFDQETSNAAHDSSVRGHHGIIHGAKWRQFRRTLGKSQNVPVPPLTTAPFSATAARQHQQDWADYLGVPVEKQIDLPGGQQLSLMLIPPGNFLIGSTDADRERFLSEAREKQDDVSADWTRSEGPKRWVRIHAPFYMAQCELTQAQWHAVMDDDPPASESGEQPVERVSWNDIAWFLGKLNTMQEQGLRFGMPTEAQWEYACRAGTWSAWHHDNTAATLHEYAWFDANADGSPHRVGQLKPNAWGLHDMYGNVREWCEDRFLANYYEQASSNDAAGPTRGRHRVLRGGGFDDRAALCRSAYRNHAPPTQAQSGFGFRLTAALEDVVLVDRPREPDWPDILPPRTPAPAVAPFDPSAAKRYQTAWADYLSVSVERDVELPGGAKLKMVLIPPGEFVMGLPESFEPSHDSSQRLVRITKPFWLSRHEITLGQFRQFAEASDYKTEAEMDGQGGEGLLFGQSLQDPRFHWRNVGYPQGDNHPVVNVTSNDAAAFCQWLSNQQSGANYELPTSAQWEYACCAGRSMAFWHFGRDESQMSKYEWFRDNSGDTTHPVGQLLPNAFGLGDMHGNVSEWCADWYGWDYVQSPTNDPAGLFSPGSLRIVRGGGMNSRAAQCRATFEDHRGPGLRARWLGFRVAQAISDGVHLMSPNEAELDVTGAWLLHERGDTNLGQIHSVKLIADGHWAVIDSDRQSGMVESFVGGTYMITDSEYVETVAYAMGTWETQIDSVNRWNILAEGNMHRLLAVGKNHEEVWRRTGSIQTTENSLEADIIGAWGRGNKRRESIKLFSDGRWCVFYFDPESGVVDWVGGGSYTLSADAYVETIEYASHTNFRQGATLDYVLSIEGDKYEQQPRGNRFYEKRTRIAGQHSVKPPVGHLPTPD